VLERICDRHVVRGNRWEIENNLLKARFAFFDKELGASTQRPLEPSSKAGLVDFAAISLYHWAATKVEALSSS
jgi:hypothetical protein